MRFREPLSSPRPLGHPSGANRDLRGHPRVARARRDVHWIVLVVIGIMALAALAAAMRLAYVLQHKNAKTYDVG